MSDTAGGWWYAAGLLRLRFGATYVLSFVTGSAIEGVELYCEFHLLLAIDAACCNDGRRDTTSS